MTEAKRIILVEGSHLLNEMLKRIFNRIDDLEVVDVLRDITILPDIIHQLRPDWVIFSQFTDNNLTENIVSIIKEHPNLHVLTITMDTGKIKIYWIGHQYKTVNVRTIEELAETLRQVPLPKINLS